MDKWYMVRVRVRARKYSSSFLFLFTFSSLTAVPSENQCMSSGAYEWPVLVALKHAVGFLSFYCRNGSEKPTVS